MSNVDFSTEPTIESLANEVACLKATLTFMLKAMGQADAGKVIINTQKFAAQLEDPAQAEVFNRTLSQIIHEYRK